MRSSQCTDQVNTIYLGGGTPSLLDRAELEKLLCTVNTAYEVSPDVELTVEANPEDLDQKTLTTLRELRVNRLSIGLQSFDDKLLTQLNRAHTAQQSADAVRHAVDMGFNNISIDLMFGLPNTDLLSWKEDMQKAIDLGVNHISCYNLTLEEKTALWHFVNKKSTLLPPEESQYDQFMYTHDFLESHGYEHYEISNYAKAGYRSAHNTNYWNRIAYFGFGPSAHSYHEGQRSWNVNNNSLYISSIRNNNLPCEKEELSAIDTFNETIMLNLRRKEGLAKSVMQSNELYSTPEFSSSLRTLLKNKELSENETSYYLSPSQLYLSDDVCAKLFLENR